MQPENKQLGTGEQPPATCSTCNGRGMVGGPTYTSPDDGGMVCPDCAPPHPVGSRQTEPFQHGQAIVKENGILFGAPMVMAILREETPKRMTRRGAAFKSLAEGLSMGFSGLVANEVRPGWWVLSSHGAGGCWEERTEQLRCPYGQVGDRLYVREAWRSVSGLDGLSGSEMADKCIDAGYRLPWAPIQYEADGHRRDWQHVGTPPHDGPPQPGRYRHARFMPRWASRILLEIVRVRVERLQAINEADAIAEGIGKTSGGLWSTYGQRGSDGTPSARASFHALWDSINGPADWGKNPWVWVVEFKPVIGRQGDHHG